MTRRFFKATCRLRLGDPGDPLTPQSHVLDPAIICHNAWSKRPSSWSRCQPPKWPARSHSSSKPANVFVSSRLTWTTVFLIQIHLNFGYNEIRSLITGVNSPMINHYWQGGSGDVCCNIPTQCFLFNYWPFWGMKWPASHLAPGKAVMELLTFASAFPWSCCIQIQHSNPTCLRGWNQVHDDGLDVLNRVINSESNLTSISI